MFAKVFRVGRDAELRHLPSGEPVINLSLAYNFGRRDGEGNRQTQWIEAGLWGKRAEALVDYLLKGKQVFAVIDELHIEVFKKTDGSAGHKLAGRVQDIELLGSRDSDGQGSAPAQRQAPATGQQRQQPPARRPAPAGGEFDDFDDQIPF